MALKLDACIAQHQGDRKEQQDRVALVAHGRTPGACLAIVADGMGGHTGGAQAAEQVVHSISSAFQEWGIKNDARQLIEGCLHEAHAMIKTSRYLNEKDPHSTAVILITLPDGRCLWSHCGDSRLYCFRGAELLTRTVDHSYVEHLVRLGKITPEMAETHPNRNILLTSLGGKDLPKVDFCDLATLHTQLRDGDSFLLCSDGLWAYFSEQELGEIISTSPAKVAAAKLVELARKRGDGKGDNVSVALLKFGQEKKQFDFRVSPQKKADLPSLWGDDKEEGRKKTSLLNTPLSELFKK
ncbi:MAG: protein phosphatase 2C domain-containing protein [Zoogloeaceae bacterium]|jgi:serine/threonine protein phosphatase PrpC|nr:protein phosphatase 2C domain-containing protein [Zoogloeaceae bacterium]